MNLNSSRFQIWCFTTFWKKELSLVCFLKYERKLLSDFKTFYCYLFVTCYFLWENFVLMGKVKFFYFFFDGKSNFFSFQSLASTTPKPLVRPGMFLNRCLDFLNLVFLVFLLCHPPWSFLLIFSLNHSWLWKIYVVLHL